MRFAGVGALIASGGVLFSCAEPLEFADWVIEVPEGTTVFEYPPVPISERDPDAIRLIEDLVIGAALDDPDAGVFAPSYVAATADGTIFVADAAMNRVQMYDKAGRHVKTLGTEGQGPGGFASLSGMTIAGDLLVVQDRSNNRYSTWTLDGEYNGERSRDSRSWRRQMQGLTDQSFIARTTVQDLDGGSMIIGRHDISGVEVARLDEVAMPPALVPDASWTRADVARAFVELLSLPTRLVTVADRRIVYVSPADEYQMLALSPDREVLWALRTAGERPMFLARNKSAIVTQAARMEAGITAADFDWPPRDRAIADILADGGGRLYVVLNVDSAAEQPQRMPVDVYSPEGDRIATGFIPARWAEPFGYFLPPWSYAVGEHVFGLREEASGETVAVRYRLEVRER